MTEKPLRFCLFLSNTQFLAADKNLAIKFGLERTGRFTCHKRAARPSDARRCSTWTRALPGWLSVCVHVFVCACVCVYTYIYIYICIYIYIYVYIYIYIYSFKRMYICVYIYVLYIFIYICFHI